MPRYFFHVQDSVKSLDTEGTELADDDGARAQAIVASGEMLKDLGARFWDGAEWRMWVSDESGRTVCALRFAPERGP